MSLLALRIKRGDGGVTGGAQAVFEGSYQLSALTLLPVAAVLVLSLLRVNVKYTLAVSSFLGILISVFLQEVSWTTLPALCVFGFHPEDPALAVLWTGAVSFPWRGYFLSFVFPPAIPECSRNRIFRRNAGWLSKAGQKNHAVRGDPYGVGAFLRGELQPDFGHYADAPAMRPD